MTHLFVSAVVLTFAASAMAEARPSSGCAKTEIAHGRRIARTLEVDGTRRQFLLDVPDTIPAGAPVPLLFDFHGWGHSGPGVWQVSKFKDIAPTEKFLTVYPDGLPVSLRPGQERPGWEIFSTDGNRDVAFTKAMLEAVASAYCVDLSRVYSTGFSNGAFFSNLLGCTMPETFAAVAPVGGGRITVPCEPAEAVPVLFHHGTKDEVVPIASALEARDRWLEVDRCEGTAKTVDGCEHHDTCRDGTEVIFCRADVGHTWPMEATQRIWEFLKRHRR